MRLTRLTVHRFGALRDVTMELGAVAHTPTASKPARGKRTPKAAPEGAAGFTLLRGANEAGKTTLLRAIRFLLLGDDRGSDGRRIAATGPFGDARVSGVVTLSSGTELEIERRKGKPAFAGRVTGGGDEAPEDWFLAALGNPDATVFRNVFAFSLDELAAGARILEKKEGNLSGLLFGSGLGGSVQPSTILDDLDKEMAPLFVAAGRVQAIPARVARIEELTSELRRVTTTADELDRLDRSLGQAEEAVALVRARVDELETQRERLQTLSKAEEPFATWRAAKNELEALGAVPALPPTARVDAETARAARALAEEELSRFEEARPALLDELSRLHVDDEILALDAEIDALATELGRAEAATGRKSERALSRARLWARSEARLAELVPSLTAARLLAMPLSGDARDRVVRLTEELKRAEEAVGDEARAVRTRRSEQEALAAMRAALPTPVETARVEAWLEDAKGALTLADRLAALEADHRRLRRQEEKERRRLDPPPPQTADAALLPLPSDGEMDAFDRRFGELEDKRRRLEHELARVDDELASLRGQLAEIQADFEVPTEGDLVAARAKRDEGWALVVHALTGHVDVAAELEYDPERPLTLAYERASLEADTLVDRMRFHADAVQRRTQKVAAVAHREAEGVRIAAALDALSAEEASARAAWLGLFAPLGITPRGPSAMRGWLTDRERWIATREELRRTEGDGAAARERVAATVARGRAVLANAGVRVDDDGLLALLSLAERVVAQERERKGHAAQVAAREAELAAALALETRRAALLEADRSACEQALRDALGALGLEACRSIDAGSRVDELARIAAALRDADREDALRDAGDDEAVRAMTKRCEALRARLSVVDADDATLAARLTKRLDAARAAKRERATLELRRAQLERESARHRAAASAANARLRDLSLAAGVGKGEPEGALDDAIARADRGRELARVIVDAERELARSRGPFTFEELCRELATPARSERVSRELSAIEVERRARTEEEDRARSDLAALRHKRERLDGSDAAAGLALDIQSERASLRADVERYATLALAKALLEKNIEAFERENQPALVAEASRLFSQMTGGRYVRIRATGRRELFVERADGSRASPDELSTGTSEQLFFSLRLAYVSLYAERAEPLPVVLDDVLVNFDRERALATLRAIATVANRFQVLFFTCHDYLADLVSEAIPTARILDLAPRSS